MTPKVKFSKIDVLQAAFRLVQKQGPQALNARNIAKNLGSSTQPIFSYYQNMSELKAELFEMVKQYHSNYFNKVEINDDLLVNIGMAYIEFAMEEPHLFMMMFMSFGFTSVKLSDFFLAFDDSCNVKLEQAFEQIFNMQSPSVYPLFIDVWLYAHGIASMLVMNQLPTPKEEIKEMLRSLYSLLEFRMKERIENESSNHH